MTRCGVAFLSVILLAACAVRTPRYAAPGDRVRVWTAPEAGMEQPISSIGEVERVSADTLTLRPEEGPLRSLTWSAIEALEIDVSRGRTALRIISCVMVPVGVAATVTDLVGDERNSERGALNGFYTLLFLDGCFFPGPSWRIARLPSAPREPAEGR